MTKEQLNEYKRILMNMLKDLQSETASALNQMSNDEANTLELSDTADKATVEANRNFLLRVKDRERGLINKVKDALRRIENGTFGICEKCGGQIEENRLDARPVTTMCLSCKVEEEEEEAKTWKWNRKK